MFMSSVCLLMCAEPFSELFAAAEKLICENSKSEPKQRSCSCDESCDKVTAFLKN